MTTRHINVSPKWYEVKPQGHYVYIHRRMTDKTIFYVGRGQNRRAWDKGLRNPHWTNTAKKNGFIVEVVKQNLSDECANSIEILLINELRKSGIRLVNISDGGEGSTGSPSTQKKKTYCSNGMIFDCTEDAAKWVRDNQGIYTTFSAISSAACGKTKSAYGLTWSYSKDIPKYVTPKERRIKAFGKSVVNSEGREFRSQQDAATWCQKNGYPSASSSKISLCCNGKRNKAYGTAWRFV